MRLFFSFSAFFLFIFSSVGQLVELKHTFVDDLTRFTPTDHLKMKSSTKQVTCGEDTLEYARYKGTGFQAIAVSNGFALGQYYDAPDSVSISGITFYGWAISTSNDSVDLTINLFESGNDTLPKGNPIRTAKITLDTTFGGGVLSVLRKHVKFSSSYKTDKPFILTIESSDSVVRAGVVCNSYTSKDGEGENIACGTVSNVWYRCLNLNISGTPLDCDVLLEPHVTYNTYAEFSVNDCFNPNDSILFTNKSSPILSHRMYNRYVFYDLERYSFYWRFGVGAGILYEIEPKYKYPSANNYEPQLITTMYSYRAGTSCRDTFKQDLSFQPSEIIVFTDTPVCSGNFASINAASSGEVSWYLSDTASQPFMAGKFLQTPVLQSDTAYYLKAVNQQCESKKIELNIPVYRTPTDPVTINDSICLNAKANLSAHSNIGDIIWWSAPTGGQALDTATVLITDKLSGSAVFYAEANNKGCKSPNRVLAVANVNANNAPAEPITSKDSLVCLYDGTAILEATSTSGHSIRWFDKPVNGTLLATGNTYTYVPNNIGTEYMYVDAYDGQCASTKVQKRITTWTFPSTPIILTDTLCNGDTLTQDYSGYSGRIRWFDQPAGGSVVYDSNIFKIYDLTGPQVFYLEPYSSLCRDTLRHPTQIELIDIGNITNITNAEICAEESADLQASADFGDIHWYGDESLSTELHVGENFTTPILTEGTQYFVLANNEGCTSEPLIVSVVVKPLPDATYDYQVNGPGTFLFDARTAGLTYSWDFGDGNTSVLKKVSHEYEFNSYFDVVLTTTNNQNCTNSFKRTVRAAGLPGSVENVEKANVLVYPNPANNIITIAVDGDAALEVTSCAGKQLKVANLRAGKNIVYLNEFATGIYQLKIETKDSVLLKKLIIKK